MATKKQTKLNVGSGGYTYTDEDKGVVPHPGGYEYTQKEWDEIRDRSAATPPTTLKNEKYKPVKVTKKEVSVETPSGDIASVQKADDVVGPDMSKVNKEAAKPAREFTAMEMAQNLMSPGYNKKKGGVIKAKGYKKGGMTASKRADGIAQRGKTRGKMI